MEKEKEQYEITWKDLSMFLLTFTCIILVCLIIYLANELAFKQYIIDEQDRFINFLLKNR